MYLWGWLNVFIASEEKMGSSTTAKTTDKSILEQGRYRYTTRGQLAEGRERVAPHFHGSCT